MSNLKWIGSPQDHVEGRGAVYRSCQIESGATVSIGDYVYMLPADPSLQLFIARVDDLFEREENKCVQVRWLYRQTELKHSPPCAPAENEVYHTNYYDCQLIQSIVGPCHVVQHTITDCATEPLTRKEPENITDIYVCRYSYSEETGEFVEVLLTELDYKCPFSRDHEKLAENVDADVKNLINILMQIEWDAPLQTETTQWPARRMVWLQKVKALTCLEDIKQALVDLEDELHIFANEPSWREQVHSIKSSDVLLCYIKNVSQKMQVNAKIRDHRKLKVNFLGQLTPRDSYRKRHKRKRASSALPSSPISQKQPSKESITCRGIYKVQQGNLPPDAPLHLKNLRVALVHDTSKDYVTIAYPSLVSLANFFEESNMCIEDGSQERKLTKCLLKQVSAFTRTQPRFDEKFRLTRKAAQKALKCLIPAPEYLKQGHLQSFWLRSGEYTITSMRETQANKDDNCDNAKENLSSSLNRREQMPSDDNFPQQPDFCTLKDAVKLETDDVMLDKNGGEVSENIIKLSEDESCSHRKETNDSTQKINMVMPLNIIDCGTIASSEQTHDTKAKSVGLEECVHKSENNAITEKDQGIVRWGIRKKITHQNRCRGNACNLDDLRNKVISYKDRVPKEQLHEVNASKHVGMNASKHVGMTCIPTYIGKGKMLKVPKDMQGRWSSERYKAAQLKLFQIMKDKGAVPGKPLLRPALREEARKHIGDTGLLDHLLKHMTDTVINNGERFRRQHNSEGAMEYWLEDARLEELRKQAGVDQYWIPPLGWKFGDAITNSKYEGLSHSQLNELRLLQEDVEKLKRSQMNELRLLEDVEKLKSQLHYVCLHLGASFAESKSTVVLGRESGFQPWKKIESIAEQAQDRNGRYMDYPEKLNCMEASIKAKQNNLVPRQANAMEDIATKDGLLLFYKAARSCLKMSPIKLSNTSRGGNAEKRSLGSDTSRSPPAEADENKENIVPEKHQSELMKACKLQKASHRQILSAKVANVQLCSSVTLD